VELKHSAVELDCTADDDRFTGLATTRHNQIYSSHHPQTVGYGWVDLAWPSSPPTVPMRAFPPEQSIGHSARAYLTTLNASGQDGQGCRTGAG
jgi:hypothetical protein